MRKTQRTAFLCLFLVSGACGLIYEVVWGRMLSLVFGGTMFAVTTVLACFMGGLAAGSWLGGRVCARIRNPARLYGILEIGIGLYCVAVPLLLDFSLPLYKSVATSSDGSFALLTATRVLISVVILAVPTCFMGATLPLLSETFEARTGDFGRSVAGLYGLNTLGAFAGCVGAGFVLLPVLGLSGSIWLAALLNISVGIAAVVIAGQLQPVAARVEAKKAPEVKDGAGAGPAPQDAAGKSALMRPWILLTVCGVAGCASMSCQVAWIRALVLAMGASVYAFSTVVAVYILGLALGSLLVTPLMGRIRAPVVVAGVLEAVTGLSVLFVVPLLGEMPGWVMQLVQTPGAAFGRILASEVFSVLGLLIVPTLCMGAVFPLLCAGYKAVCGGTGTAHDAPSAGLSVGAVYASNTAGTIIGICLTGFVLIPWAAMGIQRAIILVSAASVLAGTVLVAGWTLRRLRAAVMMCLLWIAWTVLALVSDPWSKAVMVSGPYMGRGIDRSEKVIFYREGVDSTVSVSETGGQNMVLRINGKPDASSRIEDMYTQVLAANIPLMLKPGAKTVCIVGLGSGITSGAVLDHPVERLDVAEISDGVIGAAACFSGYSGDALKNKRLRLHHADGRNFLLMRNDKYDIIICEPSNVWVSGVANLFTREFLQLASSRLNPGGLHCQWIHSYSMRPEDFAAILKTMAGVFQNLQLWATSFGDYLAICSNSPIVINMEGMRGAIRQPAVSATLAGIMIKDAAQLGCHYIADGELLASWYKGQGELVDDVPRLEFSAPRYVIRNEGMVIGTILDTIGGVPALAGGPDAGGGREFLGRIEAGRKAREYLRDSVVAAGMADSRRFLDDFLAAAASAPDDGRVLLIAVRELERQRQIKGGKASDLVENYYARIETLAPLAKQARQIIRGKPAGP